MRGLFGLAALVCMLGFLGSLYMRARVVARLKEQAVESFAVVMSKPFKISKGLPIDGAHVADRLTRLRYQKVNSTPGRPGQYFLKNDSLQIHLRGLPVSLPIEQRPMLVEASLDGAKTVTKLMDAKFREPIDEAWLEPELISLLGQAARRAVTAKSLEEFPADLIDAIVSIEDERFQYHFGVDPWAIMRAAAVNLKAGKIVQGGSTITQQLAKNLFLKSERTITRKLREAFAALLIETAFTKEEILELYLNEVFLGQEGRIAIHGFGEASMSFFSKDVSQLSLAEAATLAGIIKAPSYYSPRRNPQRALTRRKLVIDKMLERSLITAEQALAAKRAVLKVHPPQRSVRVAPYFVDYLRGRLAKSLESGNLERTPLQLHSGLDLEYQRCAQDALRDGLAQIEKRYPRVKRKDEPLEAALLSVVPPTGEIVAWVGGRDYGRSQFDHISMAKRQPGSAFKPFVYLTALDPNLNNYRAARTTSLLVDEPIELDIPGQKQWRPQNYDHKFRGDVTVREALMKSLNVPAVRVALKVGVDNVAETARVVGLDEHLPAVPSLALGAAELTPFELTKGYSVLANEGIAVEFRPVLSVTRGNEPEPLFQSVLRERRALAPQPVFVLTNMLQSVIEHGTGAGVRRRGFKRPAAGKTGTSNEARDAWFAGYTPHLLAVVWVGYDDNRPLGLTGGQAALPIWTSYMKCVEPMEPELDFIPPPGVLYRKIDYATGLLATPNCPADQVVTEVFVQGNEPQTPCPEHAERRRFFEFDDSGEFGRDDPLRARKERRKRGDSFIERVFRNLWD